MGASAATGGPSSPYLFGNGSNLRDVTSGSNGRCRFVPAYFCNAVGGYDGPTGLGSPLALRALILSLAATSAAITLALSEPPPAIRQLALLPTAAASLGGISASLLAFFRPLSPVDRTLIVCALCLGALSAGAAFLLF